MGPFDKNVQLADMNKPSRQHRVGRYKVWLLQKRLAELSAQVEASVLEARQLIAWKQGFQPLTVAELTDDDRRILEHNHRIRLAEVVQKHCSGALKSITQHKWAFPFNNPVDTARFPDYPKVITHPMDFSTIKARLEGGYYRDPKDCWSDVMLVFSNAKRYNAPGSDCYLMAQTLQEVSEEKYDKVIAPRLAEEAAATLRDEVHLKKKRAELMNQQMGEAMDAQCAVLFGLMAELHAAIREAKLLAASLCEPLTLEEKQALAATIQGLPTAQLESIVAFVASRHPASVSHSEVQPGAGTGGPSRKVQLNLGRYDPLLLRQLQHLTSTCTAARQAPQGHPPGVTPPLRIPALRPASPTPAAAVATAAAAAGAAMAAAAAGEQLRSASASPSPSSSPGQPVPAGAPATATAGPPGPASASGSPTGAADGAGAASAAAQALEPGQPAIPGTEPAAANGAGGGQQAADPQQPQQPPQQPQQPQQLAERPSGKAEGTGAATAAAAGTGTGGAVTPAAAQPPVTSTQRNISDVVTNATASGISVRAGIRWPGLAVGAGVRGRARALLSLHLDGPASAAEFVAACPLPQPAPPQRSSIGVKRRMARAQQSAEEDRVAARRRQGPASPMTAAPPQAQDPLGGSAAGGTVSGTEGGAGGSEQVDVCGEGTQQPGSAAGVSPMEMEAPVGVPGAGQGAARDGSGQEAGTVGGGEQQPAVPGGGVGGVVLDLTAPGGTTAGPGEAAHEGRGAVLGASRRSDEVPPLVLDLGVKQA